MCMDCVEEYDAASAMPPTVEMLTLVEKVTALYACEECSAGGPLHILIDDFNVGDPSIQWLRDNNDACCPNDPFWDANPDCNKIRRLSFEILDGMLPLTEAQRCAVLAIEAGYEGFAA